MKLALAETKKVGFLGKRFIVYLALAHRACQDALREHLCAKGGYILHGATFAAASAPAASHSVTGRITRFPTSQANSRPEPVPRITFPKTALHERAELNPWLTAYLLVVWVLEAGSACEG